MNCGGAGERGRERKKRMEEDNSIPLGGWLLRNPQSLQNEAGPPDSLSPSPGTQLLPGGRAGLLGDPYLGGKWKSVPIAQLLCKEKSSQENHFLAPSRVPCQTQRSQHGTSPRGRTFALKVSQTRGTEGLSARPLMYSLRGNVCGVVYISAPTSSHSDLYSSLS